MFDDVGDVLDIDTCEGQTVVVEDGREGVEDVEQGGGYFGEKGGVEGGGVLMGRADRGVREVIGQPGGTKPPERRDCR